MKDMKIYPNPISGSTNFKVNRIYKTTNSVTLKKEDKEHIKEKKEEASEEFRDIFRKQFK